MELLLDNLRNAIYKRKQSGEKTSIIPDTRLLILIALIGSLSFLMGRVALCYSLIPCPIALMTVLMSRGKAHIYALPLVILGMFSALKTGLDYPGDMIALFLCTIVFFFPVTRKLSLIYRALITGGLMVSVKTAYYLWTGLFFLYDSLTVALELLILFTFIYVFYSFFNIVDKGFTDETKPVEAIAVFSTMGMILIAGIGISSIGPISLIHLAALFLTLLVGNSIGSMEGALVGILTGMMIMIIGSEIPALAGILGCCGMVAGFFKGQRRILTAVCFAGLVLTFSLVRGYPGLYFSIYEPLIVAFAFVLIPRRAMSQLIKWLSVMKQDDLYYEMAGRKQIKEQLQGYRDVFDRLALCCGTTREFNPARDVIVQQFKGMAKAMEGIAEEMTWRPEPLIAKNPRYKLSIGVAGYAREGSVSGDSYMCTGFREGEYLIVLSDGMGRGARAAEESTLTVNTLYNLLKAGFEVELALKMINSILLLKSGDEIFSTVDMASINLYTGRVKFFKIGAAASFVKRENEVKTIKVSALPMGIIDRIPIESISFQLRKGDQIVIVSDGIADAGQGEESMDWVRSSIKEIHSKDPQTMADLIINRAVQRYGLREKDDMTVITAVVL